jgi:excisionase family DNA binding protein
MRARDPMRETTPMNETTPMDAWQRPGDIAHEAAEPSVFRVDDVACTLGIPRSTLYQWIAYGEIPALRFGRAVRLNLAAVELVRQKRSLPGRSGEE